jgi:WhiB family redox-sensing transcriptional regulator
MDPDLARSSLLTLASRPARWSPGGWRESGSCRDSDPNFFYPLGKGLAARQQAEEAKRCCSSCPSREPCLAFALTTRQDLGVWGGTTPDERRLLLRERRAQVAS